MNHKNSRLTRFFTLLMVLIMAAVPTLSASAALVSCRTDPIFTLSNGDVVTVTLDVGTDSANVKSVSYILHVPAGVTATSVVFTPGTIGKKETYRIYQDSPVGSYTSDSILTMLSGGITATVTATMDVNSVNFQSVSGYDGGHLIITINTVTTTTSAPATASKTTINTAITTSSKK